MLYDNTSKQACGYAKVVPCIWHHSTCYQGARRHQPQCTVGRCTIVTPPYTGAALLGTNACHAMPEQMRASRASWRPCQSSVGHARRTTEAIYGRSRLPPWLRDRVHSSGATTVQQRVLPTRSAGNDRCWSSSTVADMSSWRMRWFLGRLLASKGPPCRAVKHECWQLGCGDTCPSASRSNSPV